MADPAPPVSYLFRDYESAKRLADTVALHQIALGFDGLLAGRYMAVSIADGSSDNTAYDSRADAIRHQRHNATRHFYPRIPVERWSVHTCDVLLWYVRRAYDAGHREDPAHQLWVPTQKENL